jgi:hypothetical protein
VLLYVWFVSVGRWNDWPKTTSYYQQLSDAFVSGQVSLLVKPDPALLRLADPYEYSNRHNIPYPWDVVLYNGKFYLYWGPAPALILAAVRPLLSTVVDDQYLVFAFVTGTFLFSSLLVLRLRRRLFPRLKWPYVIVGILMAGFANPLPWLLNRPAVYEAAISAGQFFLMAGFYLCFIALEKSQPSYGKLGLASACWAMAIASRASLALAVGFLLLGAAGYLFRQSGKKWVRNCNLAALWLPFAAGLGGIGWYNKIRFGRWLEFGFQYQLTGMDTHIQTFSLANLPINLHNYLINPFRTLSTFPYVKPEWGGHFVFFPIPAPANYYSEQVSGLIPTVPYILLAALPVLYLLGHAWQAVKHVIGQQASKNQTGDGFFQWTALTLSGASLLVFMPILLFIAATMRYLGDAVPILVLLSTFGFWLGSQRLDGKPALRAWFDRLVILLMLFSVIVSLLLAITGYEARFEHLNPTLFDRLTRMLTP